MRNYTRTLLSAMILGLAAASGVQAAGVDSTSLLFSDSTVRKYTLSFYDTAWQTTLAANWSSDSDVYIPARFTDGTITMDSVGVRYKGNTSYTEAGSSPKKPYKIKFNAYRSQTYYGNKTLNFSNGQGDPSFLREKLAYDIVRHYLPAPLANFAEIWVDSQEIGVYTQVEQADKIYLKRWFDTTSGNLYKAGDVSSPLAYLGTDSSLYYATGLYELKTNEDTNDWSGFIRFVAALDTAQMSDSAFCRDYDKYIDADNVTKYLAFNMALSNFDSYTGSSRNYYLYQATDSSDMLILPWDLNLSFGAYSNEWNVYKVDVVDIDNLASRPLNRRVIACDSLRYRYLGWIKDMIGSYASTDSITANIARLSAIVRPHLVNDANALFDTLQFDSNQTVKCAGVPGLTYFSQKRTEYLTTMLASYLPSDYTGISTGAGRTSAWSLIRRGSLCGVSGIAAGTSVRVDVLSVDGRHLLGRELSAGETFELPRGLCLVRLRAGSAVQNFRTLNW